MAVLVDLTGGDVWLNFTALATCTGEEICVATFGARSPKFQGLTMAQAFVEGVRLDGQASGQAASVWVPLHGVAPDHFDNATAAYVVGHRLLDRSSHGDTYLGFVMAPLGTTSLTIQVSDPSTVLASASGGVAYVVRFHEFESLASAQSLAGGGAQYRHVVDVDRGFLGAFSPPTFPDGATLDAEVHAPGATYPCEVPTVSLAPYTKAGIACSQSWVLHGAPGTWAFEVTAGAQGGHYSDKAVLLWADTGFGLAFS